MALPGEKLAATMEKLNALQQEGMVAIKSKDLSRMDRERLLKHGFLRKVLNGWYIASANDHGQGESTSWYIAYWSFVKQFLEDKYEKNYCLSAEQSLKLHTENESVPLQLIVKSTSANNLPISFLDGTSLFALRAKLPNETEITEIKGIRIASLAWSIVNADSSFFATQSTEMKLALSMIKDSSDLLKILLEGGHSKIAGRLAGAYKALKRNDVADEIIKTMKAAGFDVRLQDPFNGTETVSIDFREKSPYVNRIKLMWNDMRQDVINIFPPAPGIPDNQLSYLEQVEDIYSTDAYHSLSIEKYTVTPELIEKVRSGKWDIDGKESDKNQRDAMAANGYWQTFQAVKKSIGKILEGENAGAVAELDHREWYRRLFEPSLAVGLIQASDLAGYRSSQVYIGQSKHIPLNRSAVRDAMPALFELLQAEEHTGVRAVLGHFVFVFIHPYMDGNGRIGRFLMNTMLASGGFPWTVIPVEERDTYMSALESASVQKDIKPFANFIAGLLKVKL